MATGDATATLMTTAQALLDQDGQLLIDHEALETFCNDRFQGLEDYHHRVRRVAFPLKFDSPLQEINFYTLASLLSFGAAYEDKLEDSPRDTILFGLIGLHISRVELNAGWLCSTNRGDLSNLFGINTFELVPIPPGVGEEEKQEEMVVEAKDPEHQPSQQQQQQQRRLPTSAITVERPGPLSRYVDDIVKVMHTTGERLQELGCPSMSRFILNAVKGQQPSASILTHALASTFPHFEDVIRGGEVEVRLRKKAVMLAAELYHRTRQGCPQLDFTDVKSLPPYVTASSLNLLLQAGILKPREPSLSTKDMLRPGREGVLRVAATVAVQRMWQHLVDSKREVVAVDLSYYLDDLGREEDKALKEAWSTGQGEARGQKETGRFVPSPDSLAL